MTYCNSIKSDQSSRAGASIRAALYARVSSRQQAQDGTIASQVEALQRRIAADGLAIEQEMRFIDEGYSGSTLIRPALERLRDLADVGGIDRLYVLSPDRLARKYAYQVVLVDELRRCGVEIVFLNNHELGRSPEGDMLLQVQGIVAEYERAQIMERSRRGKLHAARRGCVSAFTQAPYGYRYIPKYHGGGDAILNIVLEHAAVVRQIFQWVGVDRLSIRQVCKRLETQGISSPSGNAWWNSNTVATILRNPAYMGLAAYGRRRTGEMRQRPRPCRNSSEQPRRPRGIYATTPDQWVRFAVPAIVDEPLFAAVAAQLEENRRRKRARGTRPANLLSGLTVCKKCGYCMCAGRGGPPHNRPPRYRYYRCIGRDAHRYGGQAVCNGKAIAADTLEEAVWSDVCDFLRDPSRIAREFDRRLADEQDDRCAGEKQLLADAINRNQRAIARLIDAYADGSIEKEEFEPKVQSARRRLEQLQAQKKTQDEFEAGQAELRLVIEGIEAFSAKVNQGLRGADIDAKRDIILALVKRVEINDENIHIVYRVNPGGSTPPTSPSPILQDCPTRAGVMPPKSTAIRGETSIA
jgi:site-specific DNA recombinase